MVTACLYFQLHQPFRLRRYGVFDSDTAYFDDDRNRAILLRIADKCYRPATRLMLDLVLRHGGAFRLGFSLSGCVLDQLQAHAPDVLDNFRALAATGCVEFLAETDAHSLAFLYSRAEFREQVELHARRIESLLGRRPTVFRNTELIYSNQLADEVLAMGGFIGSLTEGVDRILDRRSPNHAYRSPGSPSLPLLLKNYRLSDDIAFRFSNHQWPHFPLTAEKFASWVKAIDGQGEVCGLFMDFETLGEHQWAETGIFAFFDRLPAAMLETGRIDFATPGECLARLKPVDTYDVPHMISWADTERDLSAWLGNAMQSGAHHELYRLEAAVKARGDEALLRDWRRLTSSDHFYYMCTKYYADGDVHKYFNPYASPYDAYINFMNVLDGVRSRAT